MRTIRLPHESGEGETVRRIVMHPHTGERVCIRGPRYLAQDNAYRQDVASAWILRRSGAELKEVDAHA